MRAGDISNFEFMCVIGKGTYGIVYKALDKKEGELVAIKKIISLCDENYGISKSILRELTILQKIKHKNIITLKYVFYGKDIEEKLKRENLRNSCLYLAFEYCDIDLLNFTKKHNLHVKEIKYIIFELLLALCHLHGNNYLHRDIKPENIFINSKGEIKLGDLGLSVEKSDNMTPTVVTLWYRSPEILLKKNRYDQKVDMWSVGCLFVELLLGSPLFPGKNDQSQLELIYQTLGCKEDVVSEDAERLNMFPYFETNVLKRVIPEKATADLIAKMLIYDPAYRISSKEALKHACFHDIEGWVLSRQLQSQSRKQAVKLRSCVAVKLRSCEAVKLRSCEAVKLRSCVAVKLRSCVASTKCEESNKNFFEKKMNNFTKKKQRLCINFRKAVPSLFNTSIYRGKNVDCKGKEIETHYPLGNCKEDTKILHVNNYFPLKHFRKFTFTKFYRGNIFKRENNVISQSSYTNDKKIDTLNEGKKKLHTFQEENKNTFVNMIKELRDEEDLNEKKNINMDSIFDDINKYINIEMYSSIYGNDIYNEMINLYVKRIIPKDYEKKYFLQPIDKSIIFHIDKYEDNIFENLLKLEFKNNANLSLLEIEMILLYIFNQPTDNVIYDIGHQSYVHKILTGRKLLFLSLRQNKGISGFLNIFESIYDKFGAGHSSTSLSAIQGMYEADWQVCRRSKNDITTLRRNYYRYFSGHNDKYVMEEEPCNDLDKIHIAIIGDGGLTGGMALEALNYISFLNSKVLIIYNDNGQVSLPTNAFSISGNRPIGSISDHLHNFVTHNSSKGDTNSSFKKKGPNIFENLNYDYVGVIDGNNTNDVINALMDIKNNKLKRATILHISTRKTSDYIMKKSPINIMHSIKKNEIFPFDVTSLDNKEVATHEGELENTHLSDPSKNLNVNTFSEETFTDVYTREMLKHLEIDRGSTVFVSPAMLGGSGLLKISEKYPNNVYDVGIAEQHAVTFSAAMATNKKVKVHLCIYSTFMQRAYDQIIHDLNLQKIPLTVIIGRSGLIGEDGATHQGIYDLTYLGVLNNASIISPSNSVDLKKALAFCQLEREEGAVFIRLPRINSLSTDYMKNRLNIDIEREEAQMADIHHLRTSFWGHARVIQMSASAVIGSGSGGGSGSGSGGRKRVAIFNMGSMLFNVVNAVREMERDPQFSEQFSFTVIDMIFLNPMDEGMIDYVVDQNTHDYLVTYEDNTIGGFSTHFNNYLIEKNYIAAHNLQIHNIYLPNRPIEHATYQEQQQDAQVDQVSLVRRIKKFLTGNFP
ncbi:1-deoxy-D-xylulose 5-phosphate synthase, putative (DXS) [Plasmodium ovale wallikeri]|uniref:1-deoxy-D-xylulose-5-phosphate synthase n=1 Tax=Plasmodium ovale wallikeri TaxID=864142 RepID=A0A1A8Z9R9_PLAOA|nr:1-deoxy-D-xylulose 5-phosphate synthase, putative (DXS) [Plasmodium ovale wallikeri]